MPPAPHGTHASRRLLPVLVVLASTGLLWHLATALLPPHAQSVGEDYSYFFPYLVAGTNWVRLHGWLSPPAFTPDFCGGIPWLGNPQSIFYSLPQLLATVTDLASAARWTFIVVATIGAAATFALLRHVFRTSTEAAALGFALFQLNGFLLFRMAVGHLTFHLLGFAPLIALMVLWPAAGSRARTGATAVAGASLAAIIYGGGIALLPPVCLGVAAIIALAQLESGLQRAAWLRFAVATLWAMPLAAIKLVPALILALHFPRHELPALMPNVGASFARLMTSLFWPAELPAFTTLATGPVTVSQHEFEYGISIVPLLLVLAAAIHWVRRRRGPMHRGPLGLLLAIGIAVTVLSTGSPSWSGVLHRIPIITTNSVGPRWWTVWLLILIVGAALSFDRISARRTPLLALCALVLFLQNGLRSLSRYTTDTTFAVYDPGAADTAMNRVRTGNLLPPIHAIARPVAVRRGDGSIPWSANDGVFRGESAVPCYDPLFGHDFRSFPATMLAAGPVLTGIPGAPINLADPRCYFGGSCAAGTRFSAGDIAMVTRFTNHESVNWYEPTWQRISGWSTAGSAVLTLVALVSWMLTGLRLPRDRAGGRAPRSAGPVQ